MFTYPRVCTLRYGSTALHSIKSQKSTLPCEWSYLSWRLEKPHSEFLVTCHVVSKGFFFHLYNTFILLNLFVRFCTTSIFNTTTEQLRLHPLFPLNEILCDKSPPLHCSFLHGSIGLLYTKYYVTPLMFGRVALSGLYRSTICSLPPTPSPFR